MADTSLEFDKSLLSAVQTVTRDETKTTFSYVWILKFEDNYILPIVVDKDGSTFILKDINRLTELSENNYTGVNSATYLSGSQSWEENIARDAADFMEWITFDNKNADNMSYPVATRINWDFGHLVNGHASVHTSRYEFTLNKGTFTAKDTYTDTVVAIWKYKYTESEEPIITPDEPEENIVTSDSSDCHGVALDNLQRQFGYTNLSDLIIKRASVWDKYFGQIAARFETEILSLDTCISNALDYYWGKLYKLSRSYTDANGNEVTLSDDLYREMLKIRAFGSRWNGTLGEMNEFLYNLFNGKKFITVTDSQSMSGGLKYEFSTLTDEEQYLFANKDILPRQAGVGLEVHVIDVDRTFGFHGTELQPFNQGVFYQGSLV